MKVEYFEKKAADLLVRLPEQLKIDAEIEAKKEGKNLSQLTRSLFIEFLQKREVLK